MRFRRPQRLDPKVTFFPPDVAMVNCEPDFDPLALLFDLLPLVPALVIVDTLAAKVSRDLPFLALCAAKDTADFSPLLMWGTLLFPSLV